MDILIHSIFKILIFLFSIFILVMIHELCHFFVAKLRGVKILRFSIGLGKPLFTHIGKDGTEYVIAPIPIGGYVKMLDGNDKTIPNDEKHLSFDKKSILSRTLIVIAGPIGNILFAIFAFMFVSIIGIESPQPIIGKVLEGSIASSAGLKTGDVIAKINQENTYSWADVLLEAIPYIGENTKLSITVKRDSETITKPNSLSLGAWQSNIYQSDLLKDLGVVPYRPFVPAIISDVSKNGAAFHAGLEKNDKILSIDNNKINTWDELVEYVEKRPEQMVNVKIQRENKIFQRQFKTAEKYGLGWKKVGYLGIKSLPSKWPKEMLYKEKYSPTKSLTVALIKTWKFFKFNTILLTKLVTGKISLHVLGGPITILQTATFAFMQGVIVYIRFLAILSVTLAFTNLLPIPGLDGGHLLFLFCEAVKRKPIPIRYQLLFYRLGIIFLVVLMVRSLINDLMRL